MTVSISLVSVSGVGDGVGIKIPVFISRRFEKECIENRAVTVFICFEKIGGVGGWLCGQLACQEAELLSCWEYR